DQLIAMVKLAKQAGVNDIMIHAITDGRDTGQKSADGYLQWLTFQLRDCPLVTLGSVCGRYTAMDRDKRWERTEQAWRLYVDGEGAQQAPDALAAIAAAYGRGETDEFVAPTRLDAFQPIADGDGVLFFNFRADRARQMCHALVHPAFAGFAPKHRPAVKLVTFTAYDGELDPYVAVAYPPQVLDHILGELVSAQGWRQFRTAETEKYAHVTYFFNGGREVPFEGEARRLVPSPKVATYDLQPEMSLPDVSDGLEKAIRSGQYRLLVCNLANPDMIGHTGDLAAAVTACEAVDAAVGRIADATLAMGGALLITADHGNCECMRDEGGNPHTAHTLNPVPAVLVARGFEARQLRAGGALRDVAPTLLKLFGLDQPGTMDGTSLY
ncbi:MAG TPA: 2,3-bisphosphoglycerate-independent phosphoglycerate mutase, partial [Geothrix sp.]|nr:2,3-bisphosphoglycerate-independent phosphoglycerate mutase [Geothrix sp.]